MKITILLLISFLAVSSCYRAEQPNANNTNTDKKTPIIYQNKAHRLITDSNWNGDVLEEKWTEEISENLQFNQGITIEKPLL